MTGRLVERAVLGMSALVLLGVGLGGLLAQEAFYEGYDIAVDGAVSLASELRGVGAALALSGLATAAGAASTRWAFPSAMVGAFVLLGYASGRLVSLLVDGVPTSAILAAGAVEVVLGTSSAVVAVRHTPGRAG